MKRFCSEVVPLSWLSIMYREKSTENHVPILIEALVTQRTPAEAQRCLNQPQARCTQTQLSGQGGPWSEEPQKPRHRCNGSSSEHTGVSTVMTWHGIDMILKAVSSLTVDMKNKHLPHTKDSTVLIPITVASLKFSRREIAQISRWNFLWLKKLELEDSLRIWKMKSWPKQTCYPCAPVKCWCEYL